MNNISVNYLRDFFALRRILFVFLCKVVFWAVFPAFIFWAAPVYDYAQAATQEELEPVSPSALYLRPPPMRQAQSAGPAEETIKEYYEDGTLKMEISVKDGKKNGLARSFYPDGTVKTALNFSHNEIWGPVKKFYKNGSLHEESYFENGKRNGKARIYDTEGKLYAEYEYKDGLIVDESYGGEKEDAAAASPVDDSMKLAQEDDDEEQEIPRRSRREEVVEEELSFWQDFFSRTDWTLGFERSFLIHNKPQKRDEVHLAGIDFSWNYAETEYETWLDFLKLDFRYMAGDSDHKGTQFINSVIDERLDDVPAYLLEGRLMIGHDLSEDVTLPVLDKVDLALLTGIGYWYFNEDPSGESIYAYGREVNYVYIPIILEAKTLFQGWTFGTNIEADVMMGGWEKSRFSDIGTITTGFVLNNTTYTRTGVLDDITNALEGYGIRGAFRMERKSKWFDFIAEPFLNFWDIRSSDSEHVFVDGVEFKETVSDQTYFAIYNLPKNNTTEYGLKLRLRF